MSIDRNTSLQDTRVIDQIVSDLMDRFRIIPRGIQCMLNHVRIITNTTHEIYEMIYLVFLIIV